MHRFYYRHYGEFKVLEFLIVDLICSILIFMNFKKRKYRYITLSIGLVFIITLFIIFLFIFKFDFYYFLFFYLLICFLMYSVFDVPRYAVFYYSCAGWYVQHLMDNITQIIDQWFNSVLMGADLTIYRSFAHTIFRVYFIYAIGIICFYFISKHFIPKDTENFKEVTIPLLCINVTGLAIVFLLSNKRFTDFSKWIPYYASLCCFLLLIIMFYINRNITKQSENAILKNLLLKEKRQYELAKQSNEQLNIKYHDLKKSIKSLEVYGVDKEYIDELKKSIKSYHTVIKTDNYALDTVLTEKNIICEGNKIKIFHSIDQDLDFPLKNYEIYSLFTNLLDNAIESVIQEDVSKRVIKLYIKNKGNFIFIKEINYTSKTNHFEDGLPLTSKENKQDHGFGVKSIKSIITKYQGTVSFDVNNSYFETTILIPKLIKDEE